MSRLIDADELLTSKWWDGMTNAFDKARAKIIIQSAKTVDAVEVTRCKDCRHFVQGEPYDPCECMKWKVKWGAVYTTPDGYCHKGERKDNG